MSVDLSSVSIPLSIWSKVEHWEYYNVKFLCGSTLVIETDQDHVDKEKKLVHFLTNEVVVNTNLGVRDCDGFICFAYLVFEKRRVGLEDPVLVSHPKEREKEMEFGLWKITTIE